MNSPAFEDESPGREGSGGNSAGVSGRNGPWKKLVNSPAFGPSVPEGLISLAGKLRMPNSAVNETPLKPVLLKSVFGRSFFAGAELSGVLASHGDADCKPDGWLGSSKSGNE